MCESRKFGYFLNLLVKITYWDAVRAVVDNSGKIFAVIWNFLASPIILELARVYSWRIWPKLNVQQSSQSPDQYSVLFACLSLQMWIRRYFDGKFVQILIIAKRRLYENFTLTSFGERWYLYNSLALINTNSKNDAFFLQRTHCCIFFWFDSSNSLNNENTKTIALWNLGQIGRFLAYWLIAKTQ